MSNTGTVRQAGGSLAGSVVRFVSERHAFNFAISGPGETCSAWIPRGDPFMGMGTDSSQLSRFLLGRNALSMVRLGHVFIQDFR